MWIRTLIAMTCAIAWTATASAEPPVTTAKNGVPRRRAEKLDAARSRSATSDRIVTVPEVEISGKPQRPLVSVEISVKPFDFPVGTARYSERDRHFLETRRASRR